jgi:multiple sugar transport system substrate-binding protein
VPSDGWGQLLLYRKDLFGAAGLDEPTTFEAIEAAASALHDPAADMNGITAATTAGEVFTQQTFEQFAVANDCQLTDGESITLGSDQCREALDFYTNLTSQYSPGTGQDVETTRSTYFAGQAAMIIWSPFILDELAGLRSDAVPTCPECEGDPRFLASNTGIIPAFAGPAGSDAQYGQVSSWGIGAGSDTAGAKEFLEWFYTEGYLDWLALSPEGKLPLRQGTAEDPEEFLQGWRDLETGVDEKATLGSIYPEEVIDLLLEGTEDFNRWGFGEGRGELVSAVYSTLPLPDAIAAVLSGESDVDAALTGAVEAAEQELSLVDG